MKLGLGLNIKTSGSADWTPAKLSNLEMWCKFDTGIQESDESTPEDGENVTKWTDQSSNNNDLTASSAHFTYDSATGGLESADSTNSILYLDTELNLSGQFAMYIRVSCSTISAGNTDLFFSDKDNISQDFLRVHNATEMRAKIQASSKIGWTQETQSMDTFYNYGVERDGSNVVTAYRGGSLLTKKTGAGYETGAVTGTLDIDAIGGAFDGIIKEVIICSSALSADDRTNLEAYLAKLTQGE